MRLPLVLATLVAAPLAAQDGGQLYATYCSACHANDGLGATGGQFPPLAESEWLRGEPDRAIKIVLHGLTGPIEVGGRGYNLIMPPQGAVLPDDQIAAILSYVRTSWGNRESAVTPQQVADIRLATAQRNKPYTATGLLKQHPIPREPSALRNLTSRIYHGQWDKLPDFDSLEARNIEEEHDGRISVTQADRKDHFGLVWEGEFVAEKSAVHRFRLACDDGARVVIDGKELLKVDGTGPISADRSDEKGIRLEAGAHPIRIEYFEARGHEDIVLAWKLPGGTSRWHYLSESETGPNRGGRPSIPIEPTTGRAAIYRNFIAGTTPRAIGIGLPGGINFAYSADHLAPELAWTGPFIDAGRHWTARGQGAQEPAGHRLVRLTRTPAFPAGARFRGYTLDPAGNPTFRITRPGVVIEDAYRARDGHLLRTLRSRGKETRTRILVADTGSIERQDDTTWRLSDTLVVRIAGGRPEFDGGKLHLTLAPADSVTLTYIWR